MCRNNCTRSKIPEHQTKYSFHRKVNHIHKDKIKIFNIFINIYRTLWCLFLGLSCSTCLFFIYRTYNKWNESPVIISFSENPISITDVTFPAITICPISKINHEIFNGTLAFSRFWELTVNCDGNISQCYNATEIDL